LLSRIAKSKISHPLLKQFVEFEIAEQETVGGILKAIRQTPLRQARFRRLAMRISCKTLTMRARRRGEKLRALKAWSEFDRDYIRYEIEGHRKLLDIQEVDLRSPDNLDQANVAKLARGMIKGHSSFSPRWTRRPKRESAQSLRPLFVLRIGRSWMPEVYCGPSLALQLHISFDVRFPSDGLMRTSPD
jgi:hypothetical protein